ncbi:HEXXH motif-containing protein [Bradyrhizobium huanghuaihaiense]
MNATSIDWERTARPQADGYDTAVALGLIETEPTPWRPLPPQRPAVNGAPSIAEGRVALRTEDPLLPAPRFVPAAQAVPAMEQALRYVRRWPLAAKQWPDIVHTIQCYHDTEQPTEGPGRLGSASHSVDARFGVIGLTVNCPLATAQAIVHEMAHHKLRAFGVANENAIRIISNPQDELYPSPIVVDRPRPMTAVLHAQLFVHPRHPARRAHAGAGGGSAGAQRHPPAARAQRIADGEGVRDLAAARPHRRAGPRVPRRVLRLVQ